jgi:glycosyltransferase involved in cell wall biosynthesis
MERNSNDMFCTSRTTFCLLMPFYIGDCVNGFQKSLDSVNVCEFDKIYIVIDGPITLEQKIFMNSLENNPLFYLIRLKKNIGLGGALNVALNQVKQDYCFRLDAGDIMFPGSVKAVKQCIRHSKVQIDLVGGQMSEHLFKAGDLDNLRRVPTLPKDIRRYAKLRNPFNHITVCFNVATARSLCGYPEDQISHEDYGFWIKFIRNKKNYMNLEHTLSSANISGFNERRSGLRYFQLEVNFLYKNIRFFHFWIFPYLLLRLPTRFSRSLRAKIYSFTRRA